MSLIICEECGAKISDMAESCPHCGCPVEKYPVVEEFEPRKKRRKKIPVIIIIVALFLLCFSSPTLLCAAPLWIPAVYFLLNWLSIKISFKKLLIEIFAVLAILFVAAAALQYFQENSIDQSIKNMSESEFKSKCEKIAYDDLFRNIESNNGKYLTFDGQILQVISDDKNQAFYLISVTNDGFFWTDNVYVVMPRDYVSEKFLEDDIVTFYGVCKGTQTYESLLKQNIEVPKVLAVYMELK